MPTFWPIGRQRDSAFLLNPVESDYPARLTHTADRVGSDTHDRLSQGGGELRPAGLLGQLVECRHGVERFGRRHGTES